MKSTKYLQKRNGENENEEKINDCLNDNDNNFNNLTDNNTS